VRRGLPLPAAETQPPPNQWLPPRETGTPLGRTTARTPELHGQRHALEIERSHPTLELLPTNADQDLPTPSGPTDLKKLSHTFLLRELLQGGRDAGSAGRVGEPAIPDSPKESIQLTLFFWSEVAGRIPMVAAGVPAAGSRGGWRDCCIVNAPERSGCGWRWSVMVGIRTRRGRRGLRLWRLAFGEEM
jgi:hypothetical protein